MTESSIKNLIAGFAENEILKHSEFGQFNNMSSKITFVSTPVNIEPPDAVLVNTLANGLLDVISTLSASVNRLTVVTLALITYVVFASNVITPPDAAGKSASSVITSTPKADASPASSKVFPTVVIDTPFIPTKLLITGEATSGLITNDSPVLSNVKLCFILTPFEALNAASIPLPDSIERIKLDVAVG
jgi:hypothetical protein